MRLHRVQCPKCHAALTSSAGIPEGQQVNCPKCKARFTAEAPVDDFEVVDEVASVHDNPPATKKRATVTSSGRSRDDADDAGHDDNRPRNPKRRRKHQSACRQLKKNLWVRIGTLAGLLAILGVLTFFLIEKRKKDQDAEEYNQKVAAYESQDSNTPRRSRSPLVVPWVFGEREATLTELANRLVGTWKPEEGDRWPTYEFRRDGTFRALIRGRTDIDGTWQITGTGRRDGLFLFQTSTRGQMKASFSFDERDRVLVVHYDAGSVRHRCQ